MTRIYLAKSNRSNPDDVSAVRQVLSRYDGVEVVEFKGGGYTHKDLLSCDLLIVVPDLSQLDDCDDAFLVPLGKGLHEQIEAFKRQSKNSCDTLMVIGCNNYGVDITTIDELEFADSSDYINYSIAILNESTDETLDNMLNNRFEHTTSKPSKTTTSYSDYMYLLIRK
jgi:hypothetical protein